MRSKNTTPCSIPDCALPVRARTWCATHYSRWRLTGTTDDAPKCRSDWRKRLLTKVNWHGPLPESCPELGPCAIWTGYLLPGSYGKLWVPPTQRWAHRLMWVAAFDTDPGEQWVLHHCDTPSCVSPAHLFLGDQTANMQDMNRKGRGNQGGHQRTASRRS